MLTKSDFYAKFYFFFSDSHNFSVPISNLPFNLPLTAAFLKLGFSGMLAPRKFCEGVDSIGQVPLSERLLCILALLGTVTLSTAYSKPWGSLHLPNLHSH